MREYWKYWHLDTDNGRQRWRFAYIYEGMEIDQDDTRFWSSATGQIILAEMKADFVFDKTQNPNSADLVFRTNKLKNKIFEITANTTSDNGTAYKKGVDFYTQLLSNEGHIAGDYGGPMFLLPGLVIVSYVTNQPLPIPHQVLIKQYFLNQQNTDGGWGLHIEGESTMYGTCLQYVALRLLGEQKNHLSLLKAKQWIHTHGGATFIPSWGKFYLSVLGAYDWQGVNSLFPEIWILPRWLPIHPGRYWCHARMVYLPMAYAFGQKLTGKITDLVKEIREEIYIDDYSQIDWKLARNQCAKEDTFRQSSPVLKVMNFMTNLYEKFAPKMWRKKALDFIISYINDEDLQTNFINIGPVNQVINSLCIWHRYGATAESFAKHVERWYDYLWVAEDGMKMQGYNGAQLWETAFLANAILESENYKDYLQPLTIMYHFIDSQQINNGIPKGNLFFRSENKGGWPFSTAAHGWPITDCTADGIKASIKLNKALTKHLGEGHLATINKQRLEEAVDLILKIQNDDGGWASYEKRRAPKWIEVLNPSEVYGEIMVDYTYVECTSSVVQGLHAFRIAYPDYNTQAIDVAIKSGIDFIKKEQQEDGSWYGSWGVCYTYATWFGLEALACVGDNYKNSENTQKACAFLISKQREDGGWGESFESCVQQRYIEHQNSQIIQTAWAILGMMAVGYDDEIVLKKAIDFLISRQNPNGDFPQEAITGVFNKNCMETYTSYRNVFPIWALARYSRLFTLS